MYERSVYVICMSVVYRNFRASAGAPVNASIYTLDILAFTGEQALAREITVFVFIHLISSVCVCV